MLLRKIAERELFGSRLHAPATRPKAHHQLHARGCEYRRLQAHRECRFLRPTPPRWCKSSNLPLDGGA